MSTPVTGFDVLCSSWISGDDVERCGPSLVSNAADLGDAAYDASYLLYELTGRKWPGVCERTVRPCRKNNCGCWGPRHGAIGPWYWQAFDGGWWWYDECSGDRCGCGTLSQVPLDGPVLEVTEVKIGGSVLDEFDGDGIREWRLDDDAFLTRMDYPGPPVVKRFWPGCQNLALDPDQPGTFEITYTWGGEPPPLGKMAAAELARELWKACDPGSVDACKIPENATRIVRAGLTIDTATKFAAAFEGGKTGLVLVDSFLAVNPNRVQPVVWSPDAEPRARHVGA